MIGDASDHIILRDTVIIGNAADNQSEKTSFIQKERGKEIKVQGTVRDMQATLMPEVEIYSTSLNKIVGKTNIHGEYLIKVPSNDVLLFRKKGYEEENVEVNGVPQIQIKMRYGSLR